MIHRTIVALAALLLLSACASRPEPIQHVVFAQLKNPADTAELLIDADRTIPAIPGVATYISGTHLDIGRTGIATDYSAAMVIGFRDVESYRGYLDHPEHIDLVNRWKPRLEWLKIYDIAPVMWQRGLTKSTPADGT